MTRYFFHLDNGKDVPDLLGMELSCINCARVEALREARQMLEEELRRGSFDPSHRVVVTDRFDRVLLTVSIREALATGADVRAA